MSKLRILLADDHRIIREGLRRLVEEQSGMEVVGEAGDGVEALRNAKELRPDMVLMDINMPVSNGVEATKKIMQECEGVKILALTAHDDADYVQRMLDAGATGFITKNADPSELLLAIKTLAEGGKYLDSKSTERVIDDFLGRKSLKGETQGKDLSEREEEVLRLVAWGYTHKEIAAQLNIGVKTVETHKTNSMSKLGLRSRVKVIEYAVSRGWLETRPT